MAAILRTKDGIVPTTSWDGQNFFDPTHPQSPAANGNEPRPLHILVEKASPSDEDRRRVLDAIAALGGDATILLPRNAGIMLTVIASQVSETEWLCEEAINVLDFLEKTLRLEVRRTPEDKGRTLCQIFVPGVVPESVVRWRAATEQEAILGAASVFFGRTVRRRPELLQRGEVR